MKGLDRVTRLLAEELDRKDAVRERAFTASRRILRESKLALQSLQRSASPGPHLRAGIEEASRLSRILAGHDDVRGHGFVEEAMQELAEAAVVAAIVAGRRLPTPKEVHVTGTAYVLGLGDAVGELRRTCLARLRTGDVAAAQETLAEMDALYSALMQFDHPASVANVRRKQDVARALIERTLGEVTVAIGGKRLEKKMDELSSMLDELEGRRKTNGKGKRKKSKEDLDVDAAWSRS